MNQWEREQIKDWWITFSHVAQNLAKGLLFLAIGLAGLIASVKF